MARAQLVKAIAEYWTEFQLENPDGDLWEEDILDVMTDMAEDAMTLLNNKGIKTLN